MNKVSSRVLSVSAILLVLVALTAWAILSFLAAPRIDNDRMSKGVDTIPIYPGGKIVDKKVIPDDHWTEPGKARITYTLPGSTSFGDLREFYVKNGFQDMMYADSGVTQFDQFMRDSIGPFRLRANGSFSDGSRLVEVSCEADYSDKRNTPYKGKPDACHHFVDSFVEVSLEYY